MNGDAVVVFLYHLFGALAFFVWFIIGVQQLMG